MKTRIRTALNLSVGQLVTPDEADAHHLCMVLRLRVGDEIGLVDGGGRCFSGRIHTLEPFQVEVFHELSLANANASRRVEAWVPLLKSKKTDGLVRQLTELGVSTIVVYLSERSVVRPNSAAIAKLVGRYERISAEATRQCRRTDEVGVRFSKTLPDSAGGFFLWEENGALVDRLWSDEQAECRILIGPEGGLSEDEARELESRSWQPIHLGARILRAETAVIAAASLAIYR